MGLHGAGLSNIIFAPPGCRVIELTTEGARAFPAYFRQLAAGCGHDYATARVRGDAEGTYRIDVAEMVAALDAAGARAG
jgi:capsular polysaccharide biosynthesis protein